MANLGTSELSTRHKHDKLLNFVVGTIAVKGLNRILLRMFSFFGLVLYSDGGMTAGESRNRLAAVLRQANALAALLIFSIINLFIKISGARTRHHNDGSS